MVKRRRMTAKQLRYFGKRRKRTYAVGVPKRKRRYVAMARRRVRGMSFSRGGFGGIMSMIAPVIGGVADRYLDPMIPGLDGIGATGVGFILKNNTVRDIGLYKLGYSIGNIIPLPGRNGGGSVQGGLL